MARPCKHNPLKCVEGSPYDLSQCRVCWLFVHDPDFRQRWGGDPATALSAPGQPVPAPPPQDRSTPCLHRCQELRTVRCTSCRGEVHVKVFACNLHRECTIGRQVRGPVACCATCLDYRPAVMTARGKPEKAIRWAYGVTTVPERRGELLPRTLASLARAGFDRPHLFIDGAADLLEWRRQFGLEVSVRHPRILTFGNWILGLWELYIRHPHADRYAMFQDDLVACRGLREYLECCEMPSNGYWNLYTFPENQAMAPATNGWYPSNQRGLGAVGLVFARDAVLKLLGSQSHILDRPQHPKFSWKKLDGAIVCALGKQGIREYVHNPSLLQHTGTASTMENRQHPDAPSFRGEEWDAMELVGKKV